MQTLVHQQRAAGDDQSRLAYFQRNRVDRPAPSITPIMRAHPFGMPFSKQIAGRLCGPLSATDTTQSTTSRLLLKARKLVGAARARQTSDITATMETASLLPYPR
ncbi:hypothetical protein [Xanthomonas nasturtii]|uniref:hypothetical protein n=1 Tax=Xanthomonas nasturtii TaxID=1843581 RepID=UPI002B22E0C4|nr:hypothetical protein [Xanthomonas nasturtii]